MERLWVTLYFAHILNSYFMLLYLQMKVGALLAPPLLQTLLTLVCNKFISTYWNINACCIMPCRDIVSFLKSTRTGQNSQGLQVTINVWFWAVFFLFHSFLFWDAYFIIADYSFISLTSLVSNLIVLLMRITRLIWDHNNKLYCVEIHGKSFVK